MQIVHETETQRQHVRLRIPITVTIDGKTYVGKDWSVAGAAVEGLQPAPRVGQRVPLVLNFDFESFQFEIKVEGEVRRATTDGEVGFLFAGMSPTSLSLLQYLVGAYLSGEVVVSGDVLAIAKRENYTAPRKQKGVEPQRVAFLPMAQRFVMLGVLWAIGLGLVAFIVLSAYTRAFVIKADGVLTSPDAQIIRSPDAGTVLSIDARPGARVAPDQIVASIQGVDNQVKTIVAGCDCVAGESIAAPGAFLSRGAPLLNLVPRTGRLSAEFLVPLEQARRIKAGDRAMVTFYLSDRQARGQVERVILPSFNETNSYARVSQGLVQLTAVVRVRFSDPLPVSNVGQPASVRINALPQP